MALTAQQQNAVTLLLDVRLSAAQVAEKLGINDRTLRRWQEMPEFAAIIAEAREQLFKRNRQHMLACQQGRLDTKLERHRKLSAKLTRVLDDSDILSLEHTRIYLAISRELSRLEAEIARELGQEKPEKIEEKFVEPEADFSTFSQDELICFHILDNKLAAANPWLLKDIHYPLNKYDHELCARLAVQIIAARELEIANNPDISGHDSLPA